MSTQTTDLRPADLEANPSLIEVGMGATLVTALRGFYSPYTIVQVDRGGKQLWLQADTSIVVKRAEQMGDDTEYRFEPNPDGKVVVVTQRKDGRWIQKGQPMERWATQYVPGFRRDWYDISS